MLTGAREGPSSATAESFRNEIQNAAPKASSEGGYGPADPPTTTESSATSRARTTNGTAMAEARRVCIGSPP
jgi:hypothetical protein